MPVSTKKVFEEVVYSYGCIHRPWLSERGRALKDHARAWIDIFKTKSDQVTSRQSGLDCVHHFSVILDAKMGTRVFNHTQ